MPSTPYEDLYSMKRWKTHADDALEWLKDALRRLPDREDLYEFERLHPTTLGEAIGFFAAGGEPRPDRRKEVPLGGPPAVAGLPPPEPDSLGALAVSAADAFTPPLPVARIPDATVPTWDVGGAGTISVPGGEEALARIQQQAQEWMARQGMPGAPRLGGTLSMGSASAPPSGIDLSLPAAPPLKPQIFREGVRFPAREISEDWGGISEREELERDKLRADAEQSRAHGAATLMNAQTAAADADIRRENEAKIKMLAVQADRIIGAAANEQRPWGDPALNDLLNPIADQLAALGYYPPNGWSDVYNRALKHALDRYDRMQQPMPAAPGAVDWKTKDAKFGLS